MTKMVMTVPLALIFGTLVLAQSTSSSSGTDASSSSGYWNSQWGSESSTGTGNVSASSAGSSSNDACFQQKDQARCYEVAYCFWNALGACDDWLNYPFEDTGPIVVYGVRFNPIHPAVGFPIHVFIYYNGVVSLTSSVGLVTDTQQCTAGASFTALSNLDTYNLIAETDLTVNNPGTYYMCVSSTTSSATYSVAYSIGMAQSSVQQFTVSPTQLFQGDIALFSFSGSYLTTSDHLAIALPDGTNDCPPVNSAVYTQIAAATADGSHSEAGLTVQQAGVCNVCYVTKAGTVPLLLGAITVAAAIATVPSAIAATSASIPTFNGLQVTDMNARYCAGVVNPSVTNSIQPSQLPTAYAAGPLIHPVAYRIQYGNLFSSYATSDTCLIAIKPTPQSGFNYDSLLVTFTSVSVDYTDEIRIFTPNGAVPECSSYKASKCPLWCTSNKSACFPPTSTLRCPSTIPGYNYIGRMTYDTFISGTTDVASTYAGGVILAVCTDNNVGSGSGFAVKYAAQQGRCPNNCIDQNGVRRGSCRLSGLSFKCFCQAGYFGEGCGSKVTCKDTESITGVTGTRPVWFDRSTTCGFQITATADRSDPFFIRTGVGIEFSNITLGSNCTQSRITIRESSGSGKLIKMYCSTDFSSTTNRVLVKTASTAYVQFDGVLNDAVTINYASVSLVCPGGDTVCGGKGTCVDADFVAPQTMSRYSKRCRCVSPYAPQSTYASCTVCEFGSNQLTYPTCTDLRTCSSDSECNEGTCVQGRCTCLSGYAGNKCGTSTSDYTPDAISISPAVMRLPLDGTATNIVRGGSTDGSLMPCQLPGAPAPCTITVRNTGSNQRADNHSTSGVEFNTLVVDNTYRDFVQLNNATGANLDISLPATITAWVKLNSKSQGFLIAKIDSAFYSTGEPPALLRALNDIKSRTMPDNELLLGNDDLAVYLGIYLNAPQQRIDLITTKGKKNGAKENWHVVRHFRIGSGSHLFDGNWRYLAVVLRNRVDGKLEAAVYVDGYTELGSVTYSQCIPFAPSSFQSKINSSDADLTELETGGSIYVGYHLQASVSDVRIYNRDLSQSSIVQIGGSQFDGNLTVPTTTLMVLAGVCALTLLICLILAVIGIIKRRRTTATTEDGKELSPEAKYHERVIVMVQASQAAKQSEVETLPHTPQDDADEKPQEESNHGLRKPGAIATTAVKSAQNANDGAAVAVGMGDSGFTLQTLLSFVAHLGHQLSLRVAIAMGAWQVVSVWLQTLSFPTDFRSYGGKASDFLSLDFANASIPIDFVTMLYAKIAIAVVAFLILVVLYATEKTKTREEMLELHATHLRERKEAEEKNESWSPKLTCRQTLAAIALLIVTTLYMPVTQSSVAVVFCHPSVQCVFDCYNEPAYWTAMVWSAVGLFFISILTPAAAISIVSFARRQFEVLAADEMTNDDVLDDIWTQHVIVDASPYADLYLGIEYKWAHFQAIVMIVKAVMCLASLALAEQSVQQLGAIVAIQALFSLFTFFTTPFTLQVCDAMMSISQLYVIVILGLSCLNRINEQYPVGIVANASSAFTIVVQLILLVVPSQR